MELIQSLYQELKKVAGDVPVRPLVAITDKELPIIVYSLMGGQRDLFYSGSYGVARTELTVNVYSKSYLQLQSLKDNIVNHFHGMSGNIGKQTVTNIGKATVGTILDSFDDRLENVYRTIITVDVLN